RLSPTRPNYPAEARSVSTGALEGSSTGAAASNTSKPRDGVVSTGCARATRAGPRAVRVWVSTTAQRTNCSAAPAAVSHNPSEANATVDTPRTTTIVADVISAGFTRLRIVGTTPAAITNPPTARTRSCQL